MTDIRFETTPEQRVNAASLATKMQSAGLPVSFVDAVLRLALVDLGAYQLMELWDEAGTSTDQDEAVADLQELLDDQSDRPPGIETRPRISYASIGAVASEVLKHKKRLRELIDRNGGVTEVARRAGIPQPSLSRMLASASMPRRSTLYKIAQALDVEESEIVGEWVR
jgi:DNA-binding Xre family transcriptional regulator